MRRSLRVIFDLLERIAPFLFVLTLATAVGAPLASLVVLKRVSLNEPLLRHSPDSRSVSPAADSRS